MTSIVTFLSAQTLASLSVTAFQNFQTADVQALTVTDVAALSASQINGLDNNGGSNTNIQQLTSTQITGISATAFQGLSLNALAALTFGQIGDLTTTQLGKMTSTQADDMLGDLSPFSASQSDWQAFTAAQIDAISASAIAGLSSTAAQHFTVAELDALTSSQAAALSTTALNQIGAVGGFINGSNGTANTNISALDTTFIQSLTGSQLNALNQASLANLTTKSDCRSDHVAGRQPRDDYDLRAVIDAGQGVHHDPDFQPLQLLDQ